MREHLQFYAQLKGIARRDRVVEVQQTAQKVPCPPPHPPLEWKGTFTLSSEGIRATTAWWYSHTLSTTNMSRWVQPCIRLEMIDTTAFCVCARPSPDAVRASWILTAMRSTCGPLHSVVASVAACP